METLRNKIANADKIRVSGMLEGFTVTSPVKGVYNVTTRPHGGTYEWTLDDIMTQVEEMRKVKGQSVSIHEFNYATNKWITL